MSLIHCFAQRILFVFSIRWDLSFCIFSQETSVLSPLHFSSCVCVHVLHVLVFFCQGYLQMCGKWNVLFVHSGIVLKKSEAYWHNWQYLCKSLLGLCSWFHLGGLKGLYKEVYFAWKWHNYFIVFQGEGCRTVPLSGHVGFDSLPDQLVNKSVNHGFCFNILCVGEYFHFGKFSCWKVFCSWM